MSRLANKRCVITGAGAGMGKAAAQTFAREGGAVALLDISAEAVQAAAAEIEASGGRASAHVCDVTSEDSVRRAIADAAAQMGGVDVCWANAGTGDIGTVLTTTLEHWDRILRINLTGMFLTAKYVLPHMIEAGGGSLIFTSSRGVLRGTPNVCSNMAAKGGVLGLTRQIATDFAAQQIRVNAICPGATVTAALTTAFEDRDDQAGAPRGTALKGAEASHPRGRLGLPEDLANVALFLASDDSAWVNGQFIDVAGAIT